MNIEWQGPVEPSPVIKTDFSSRTDCQPIFKQVPIYRSQADRKLFPLVSQLSSVRFRVGQLISG